MLRNHAAKNTHKPNFGGRKQWNQTAESAKCGLRITLRQAIPSAYHARSAAVNVRRFITSETVKAETESDSEHAEIAVRVSGLTNMSKSKITYM